MSGILLSALLKFIYLICTTPIVYLRKIRCKMIKDLSKTTQLVILPLVPIIWGLIIMTTFILKEHLQLCPNYLFHEQIQGSANCSVETNKSH